MPKKKKLTATITPNKPVTPASKTVQTVSASAPVQKQDVNILYFIETSKQGINPNHTKVIQRQLENITGDKLFLLLHTYGGDIYSAVKIMKILQNKFKEIIVIIPEYAFSSGTVMALGCDEIQMGVSSTLGPLDLPMEHPKEGSIISSLDITNTLTNLASICTSIGMQVYKELRKDDEDLKLGKDFASKLAFETATKIVHPIIDKIDPFNLQRGYREAKIGLSYAIDLLYSRMMKGNITQALETSSALVNDYPSHGFGIFKEEAENVLKLKIKAMESEPVWLAISQNFNTLKTDYTKYIKYETIKI